jgi:hypothetical protein
LLEFSAFELEALDQGYVVHHPRYRQGYEAAASEDADQARHEHEQDKPDRGVADRLVDRPEKLGLGHDDGELPALQP